MKRYVPRPKESPTAWFRCMTRNCDCKMIKCEVAEKNILNAMLYCDAITDTMTKGLEQQKACVRYNILTSAMDVTFLYYLLPKYGMEGYFVSFLVTHLVNFILSLRRLLRITGERLPPPHSPAGPVRRAGCTMGRSETGCGFGTVRGLSHSAVLSVYPVSGLQKRGFYLVFPPYPGKMRKKGSGEPT